MFGQIYQKRILTLGFSFLGASWLLDSVSWIITCVLKCSNSSWSSLDWLYVTRNLYISFRFSLLTCAVDPWTKCKLGALHPPHTVQKSTNKFWLPSTWTINSLLWIESLTDSIHSSLTCILYVTYTVYCILTIK